MTVAWGNVTRTEVVRAIEEYDRLGPEAFFAAHGFAPTTTYDLVWDDRRYPPKAILGTAYEFATGQRLASSDFEGGKSGAVTVLGNGLHRPAAAITRRRARLPPRRRRITDSGARRESAESVLNTYF